MDEIISPFVKFLSNTIMVNIHSYPSFSMETILSTVICIVHCLLIIEVNSLYRRTNAKAAAKLRLRHCVKGEEECSYHTLSQYQTQIYPQKIETTTTRQSFYVPYKRIGRKVSAASNFGWVVSHHGDSVLRHSFNERVEHLLSISPSEYVRKDKERKSREAGLRTCIQSLTSLLEKALGDKSEVETLSKDAIKKSLNTIRESFATHISKDTYPLGSFASASLQSLIANSINRRSLRNSLIPKLTVTDTAIDNKFSEIDTKAEADEDVDDQHQMEDSLMDMVENDRDGSIVNLVEVKSSTNVSELLTDSMDEDDMEVITEETRQQQICYA